MSEWKNIDEVVMAEDVEKANEYLKAGYRVLDVKVLRKKEQLENGKEYEFDALVFLMGKHVPVARELWHRLASGGEWAFADRMELAPLVEKMKANKNEWKDDHYLYSLSHDGRFVRRVQLE